ncbi:hypothetical protein KRIGEM_03047 (plasmid) [Komagataeibacter rhaeticus]|nr:hypothetical protein KRIGEM_03047 [Komagataeibacter rhaeticus]
MFGFAYQTGFRFNVFLFLIFLHDLLEHIGNLDGTDLGCPSLVVGRNDLAEGDGPLHRFGDSCPFTRQSARRQRLPASNNFGGIGDGQAVIGVIQKLLDTTADGSLVNRQHDDLVVHQQFAPNGLGEGDDMELWPVDGLIVHAIDNGPFLFGLFPRHIAVNTRGGSHVESVPASQIILVMDADEGAIVFLTPESDPCCPVRFIADDQIELGEVMLFLGTADDIDGMIGRKHDRHMRVVMPFGVFGRQTAGTGGCRVADFVDVDLNLVVVLRLLFSHVTVGTDREAVERHLTFLGPFGQGLGQQGQAGDEEQDTTTGPDLLLRDFQAGESLARPTGHDQTATVMTLESCQNPADGGFLMLAGFLLCPQDRSNLGLILRPVNQAGFQDGVDGPHAASMCHAGVGMTIQRRPPG